MKTIVITGASDGIGASAARQLTEKGHHVVIVGRSKEKTEKLAKELQAPFHVVNFAQLADVKRLAAELEAYDRIDVLANNAGGIMGNRELTEDGFEKTFQVNHLAPFLLTNLLLEQLIASKATVIQTASIAANLFGKDFNINDLHNEQNYTPQGAYGNGKLANILFTRELDRRYRDKGIHTVAFHPGVVRSGFANDTTHLMRVAYHSLLKYLFTISPEKSAQRLVKLIEGQPSKDWLLGEVYDKEKPMKVSFQDHGAISKQLWEQSAQMVSAYLR